MKPEIKIGTRDSRLAVWQAELVQKLLSDKGYNSSLVFIKSEGDLDLQTPLYEMGVQGIFTKSLDAALLSGEVDIAVHSMKDVPTMPAAGITQAAVLKRGNYKDLFVMNPSIEETEVYSFDLLSKYLAPASIHDDPFPGSDYIVATSSIRRKAQWLHRFPKHKIENLRGNVVTRLDKIGESKWHGAIMAAAGLERINVRPEHSIELDWMLPAPAQGAVMVVSRSGETELLEILSKLNHEETALCTGIERDFLRSLMGGCSTPISALAVKDGKNIWFRGNMLTTDGLKKVEIEKHTQISDVAGLGAKLAGMILRDGGQEIADTIRNA